MLCRCLRRSPNFNPSMGSNASCFICCIKKHLSPSTVSHTHWHPHRKRWASITAVEPALIQHWFNVSCLLCLAIIGLELCWASVNVRQWWDSARIYCVSSQQAQYVGPMLIKCWTSVVAGGPVVDQHRAIVLCLLGCSPQNIRKAFSKC